MILNPFVYFGFARYSWSRELNTLKARNYSYHIAFAD